MSKVAIVKYKDYDSSVKEALDLIGASDVLKRQKKIVLKPNLTTTNKPPVTTDVNCIKAILNYIGSCNQRARVIVAEGSGDCDTDEAFEKLGYLDLVERYGVELVDLNDDDVITLKDPEALVLKEYLMPKTLKDAFLVSVPVLKEHGDDLVTISMKNLFGIAPGKYYHGEHTWNKAKLHSLGVWQCICDLNRYKPINLAIVDAKIGQYGFHLSEKPPKEPLKSILAGFDAVAVDSVGAKMLGHDWRDVKHLNYANGRLGTADLDKIDVIGELRESPNPSRKDRVITALIRKGSHLKRIPGVKTVGKAVLGRI